LYDTLRRAVSSIGNPSAASVCVLMQKYQFVRDVLQTRKDELHMQTLIDLAFGLDRDLRLVELPCRTADDPRATKRASAADHNAEDGDVKRARLGCDAVIAGNIAEPSCQSQFESGFFGRSTVDGRPLSSEVELLYTRDNFGFFTDDHLYEVAETADSKNISNQHNECDLWCEPPDAALRDVGLDDTVEYPDFFEKQSECRCGMHALNNVLGEHFFSREDMSHALTVFLDENDSLGDAREDHEGEGGWYSVEVMATALKSTCMAKLNRVVFELSLQALSGSPHAIDNEEVIGAIVNRDGRHWYALRREGKSIWKLDSLDPAPVLLTWEGYVALVRQHTAYPVVRIGAAVSVASAVWEYEEEDIFGFGRFNNEG